MSHIIYRPFVMLQLLVGELLFLYPYKKRKHFWLRLLIAYIVCIVFSFFYPEATEPAETIKKVVKFILYLLLTSVSYHICFDLKFKVTLSLCSAGYALQHMIFQFSTLFQSLPLGEGFTAFAVNYHRPIEMTIFVIMYIAFFFTFGKMIAKRRVDKNFNNLLNFFAIFVVIVCIILSLFSQNSDRPISVSLYSIICCLLALVLQFALLNITQLNQENENIKKKLESDVARYESVKDAIEYINCKCHDLKKELKFLHGRVEAGELEQLENTIENYDKIPHTGNVIIDTIMVNAALQQAQSGVTFTFFGNGEWLNFVADADLKALFMNLVSNAMEAAAQVEEDKRNVSIVLVKKGNIVMITVRNYYAGAPIALDSFPESTKNENREEHGFGLKSMALVAKKYNGTIALLGKDGIFTLNIYLLDND
jgi:FtsH-binding integral membrane protein